MNELRAITPDRIASQRVADAIMVAERWGRLEQFFVKEAGKSRGKEIVDAMREMFALFDRGLVEWLAKLYDKNIGGFYYSNSARENPQFLPDVESTAQALGLLVSTGMLEHFDNEVKKALPEKMCQDIKRWVKGLQDENGYFYHPQWGKEATDKNLIRRGRDVGMAMIALKRVGGMPTYDSPNGEKGDGILPDGTPVSERVGNEKSSSAPAPEVKLLDIWNTGKAPDESGVAPYLLDRESFVEYLEGIDINGNSYHHGSALESQSAQILERDRVLRESGADYSLCDILADWLTKHQNPKTGLWTLSDEVDYMGVNGLLKISSTYSRIGKPVPRATLALDSAMKAISFDEEPETVCFTLNPWYAIVVITANVLKYSSGDEEALKSVGEFKNHLYDNYPLLIRKTTANMAKFKKPDGSFSYLQNRTAACSQGMPVALMNENEGDVNATLCIRSTLGHVMDIFGHYSAVPMYTLSDLMQFLYIIENE